MADIIPFKGILYNDKKIKDLSKVLAPPYDVISPKEQEELYNLHPYNIIRILLGKDFAGDNEKNNKYIRAASFMNDWQKKGILEKDHRPGIYINLQEFNIDGQVKERLGFIALLKLENFDTKESSVYPHENTLTAPKLDRLELIRAIEANLGPIFAIYGDDNSSIDRVLKRAIKKTKPIIDVVDSHGIRNKLWRLSDKDEAIRIVNLMKDRKIFIADGHHRYEVGLEFSKHNKDRKFGYILTYFTDLYGDGVVILPVHRLVAGLNNEMLMAMENDLKKSFILEEISSKDEAKDFLSAAKAREGRFVIYKQKNFTGLILRNKRCLDVTLVKDLIIDPLMRRASLSHGISKDNEISVDFTKDFDYAINEVDKKRFSLAVLLNPVKITEIRDVAFSGRRMPEKSTYFYPKVLTGLVINVF